MKKKKPAHEIIVNLIEIHYTGGALVSPKECGRITVLLCEILEDIDIPEEDILKVIEKLVEITDIDLPWAFEDMRVSAVTSLIRMLKDQFL